MSQPTPSRSQPTHHRLRRRARSACRRYNAAPLPGFAARWVRPRWGARYRAEVVPLAKLRPGDETPGLRRL